MGRGLTTPSWEVTAEKAREYIYKGFQFNLRKGVH